MQEPIVFVELEGSKWNDGVALDEYNGIFSVVAAQRSRTNGKIYKRYAFPQNKDKKAVDTAVPMGVRLGNRTQAIQILKQALAALSDRSGQLPNNDPVPRAKDDGIPF
jgi:hypothetical protein